MRTLLFTSLVVIATSVTKAQTAPTTTVGALQVQDSLNVVKDITARQDVNVMGRVAVEGEVIAKDTLTAQENINAQKDIKVDGSMRINHDVTVEGKIHAKDGITFDALNSLKFTPATSTTGDVFKLGKGVYAPIPLECVRATYDPLLYFGGGIQLFDFKIGQAVSLGSDGNTSSLEATGLNNALKVNYYCGKPTYINTGWSFDPTALKDGGAVFMGAEVDMQKSLKIGESGNTNFDENTAIEIYPNMANGTGNGVKIKTINPASVLAFSVEYPNGVRSFEVRGEGNTTINSKAINALEIKNGVSSSTRFLVKNTGETFTGALTVNGVAKITSLIGTGNRPLQVNANGDLITSVAGTQGAAWELGGNASAGLAFGTNDNSDLPIKTKNITRAIFDKNGNIYFGTKKIQTNHAHGNSQYQFDGKLACKELVVVDPVKWADFVFANDYELMPLTDVENYYKTNHHLPSVPSEAEVKQNGINTAEMDALLIQKIEELTLYIVQQQKEIDALKKEIKK